MVQNEVRPRKIRLEASSVCQLKCPSCPNTTGAMHSVIGHGFLSPVDFRRLIETNRFVKEIELSNYGEMFLNTDLLEIMECAYEQRVTLRADNGVNLNRVGDDLLEGLVKYSFKSMSCSLDGAGNESYSQYRVNGNFTAVIENIRKINEFKKRYHSRYPRLAWQFVVFGFNEHEIDRARSMAHELDMDFRLKLSWDEGLSPVRNRDLVRRDLGFASREEYRQMMRIDYIRNICHKLWEQPQINWDGKILGCCRNFWGDLGGNAFRDGLIASLNNEKIIYARDMLIGRRIPREDIPCFSCSVFQGRKARGRYLNRSLSYRSLRYVHRKLGLARYRKLNQVAGKFGFT